MDWTNAFVAICSAALGAAAHAIYAVWYRRNYWSDFHLALQHGKRRQNSMRKRAPVKRNRLRHIALRSLRDFDV
jgi:hypothetical protein